MIGMACCFVRFSLVTLLGVAMFAARVDAECPTRPLEAVFAESTVVFVGRAIDQKLGPEIRNTVATITTFEIEDLWKGKPQKTIAVTSLGGALPNGTAVTVSESPRFQPGSRYVVFAAGSPLMPQGCNQTTDVEHAAPTLEWLSNKPHVTVRPSN